MLAGVREDRAERRDLDPPEQQLPDIRAEHPRPLPLCYRLGFPRVKIHLFSKIGNSSTVASLYFSVSEHTKRGLCNYYWYKYFLLFAFFAILC